MKRVRLPLAVFITQLILFLSTTTSVFAQGTQSFEQQRPGATGDAACVIDGVVTIRGIECLLTNIFSIAISGIGFAGFVMLIVGSFQFLMSGGDPKGTAGGKNTMTFAIVGLVVALSSWIILNFIATFTGVQTIKTFTTFFGG